MSKGIGGHTKPNNGATNEWFTPPEIIKALGCFDLDPCSALVMPWQTAKVMYAYCGLSAVWKGRVWLNPPYGTQCGTWLERLAEHGNGIALIFARTETEMFRQFVWARADAVFFFYGRIHFHKPDGSRAKGNAGGPSCLAIYGEHNVQAVAASGLAGKLVRL